MPNLALVGKAGTGVHKLENMVKYCFLAAVFRLAAGAFPPLSPLSSLLFLTFSSALSAFFPSLFLPSHLPFPIHAPPSPFLSSLASPSFRPLPLNLKFGACGHSVGPAATGCR